MPRKKHQVKDPIYIPNKKYNLTDWLPPINRNNSESFVETYGWFDAIYYGNPNKTKPEEYDTFAPVIPEESYKQQLKSINRLKGRNPELDKDPVFLYTKKVRIYPTKEQAVILQKWLNLCTSMYNVAVNHIRHHIFENGDLQLDAAIKFVKFESIRNDLKEAKEKIQQSYADYKIPIHVLDEAIREAVTNYKSCLTNLQRGHIKKFHVKELPYNRRHKILKLEANFFRDNTFCLDTFDHITASQSFEIVERTATLQYNQDNRKYILFVPQELNSRSAVQFLR